MNEQDETPTADSGRLPDASCSASRRITEKRFLLLATAAIIFNLLLVAVLIWVAVHFIIKWW